MRSTSQRVRPINQWRQRCLQQNEATLVRVNERPRSLERMTSVARGSCDDTKKTGNRGTVTTHQHVSPAPPKTAAEEIVTTTPKSPATNGLRRLGRRVSVSEVWLSETSDGEGDVIAAQKSPRIEMVQSDRKIPWTTAAGLSFTVGWWKESLR